MANGVPRSTNPPGAVVIDLRVWIVGGAVAVVGLVVLFAFLWMVPHAAEREVKSACEAMRSIQPNADPNARCARGDEACERAITLAQALCKQGEPCRWPMRAPDFAAVDYRGQHVHLSDFRGKKVLLNFWASWCGVCESEKPHLNEMAGDLTSNDFAVVALASDRTWTDVLLAIVKSIAGEAALPHGDHISIEQALSAYQAALPDGVPFQVYLDPPDDDGNIGAIAKSWGLHAVPDSVFIDREGNIRAYFVNKRDWQSPVAETCLRSLIDGD